MTANKHWVLPQGIEEALPEQAARLESLRRELLDMYSSWGYELVIPPFIDHIESLLTGTGHELDLQTFKIVDQLSGRTLGIRADMTPQVARIDAHQLGRNVPTRLCYIGTVLHTRSDCFGSSRSPLQVGAELYGHAGVESDVEILALMLNSFAVAGVEDVYLDLGNVDVFRALARQAKLENDVESRLFEMLQRKAVTEIGELLDTLELKKSLRAMLTSLATLNGDAGVLETARSVLAEADTSVHAAIDYLQHTVDAISKDFPNIPLNIDLAELDGYHYQTGVVFAAFVPQLGQALARGGRYDNIGSLFGRKRAATGFSTDLKLLSTLSTRAFNSKDRVYAPAGSEPSLLDAIADLRAQGVCVIRQLSGQNDTASAMACNKQLQKSKGQWLLKDVQ
jgi:ATP phosphoribosyltransferase regulatory subunit